MLLYSWHSCILYPLYIGSTATNYSPKDFRELSFNKDSKDSLLDTLTFSDQAMVSRIPEREQRTIKSVRAYGVDVPLERLPGKF